MIPPIGELQERLLAPCHEFEAWAQSLPPTHWAKRDISAARLGWEAARAALPQSPTQEGEK